MGIIKMAIDYGHFIMAISLWPMVDEMVTITCTMSNDAKISVADSLMANFSRALKRITSFLGWRTKARWFAIVRYGLKWFPKVEVELKFYLELNLSLTLTYLSF